MPDDKLISICKSNTRPIVTVRTNAAPTLWALFDTTQEYLAPFNDRSRDTGAGCTAPRRQAFLGTTPKGSAGRRTDLSAVTTRPRSSSTMVDFRRHKMKCSCSVSHQAPWEERAGLARQLGAARYRRLALRLIYLERPDLLTTEHRCAADDEVRKRLMAPLDTDIPWRSIPAARRDIDTLLASGLEGDALANQLRYLDYLKERTDALAQPMSV